MKKLSFVLFAVILCMNPVFALINTDDIEAVRARTEKSSTDLSASDKAVIVRFWETASNTMPLAESANEIVQIRRQLEEQKGTESLSFYATAYITVAREKLQTAFQTVEGISDPERKELIERNLMILTSQLKSAQLVPLALQKMNDKDDVVRYWAAKAVTQPAVISQLISDVSGDAETIASILKSLSGRVDFEQSNRILEMIISFAAAVDDAEGRQLLLKIADKRIASYKDWSIVDDVVDVKLLIAMSNIIANQQNATVVGQFAQKFAILYSSAFQRHMLGAEILTEQQSILVKTLIAEIAETALDKNLGISTRIVDALRRNMGLDREYEALFGDRMRAGELALKYKFDYGKDASGKAITEPPKLNTPPAASAETN